MVVIISMILLTADTMITMGSISDEDLRGSAIRTTQNEQPAEGNVTLVRIMFSDGERTEELNFPINQCDTWFVSKIKSPPRGR